MNTTAQQPQPNVMDAIITRHNTAENGMIQNFGDNSVTLVTSFDLKRTAVLVNHDIKIIQDDLTLVELEKLQQEAYAIWLALQN